MVKLNMLSVILIFQTLKRNRKFKTKVKIQPTNNGKIIKKYITHNIYFETDKYLSINYSLKPTKNPIKNLCVLRNILR